MKQNELEQAYRLILEANETALKRGDKYGLCDSIDRRGNPYPSQWGADILHRASDYIAEVDGTPTVEIRVGLLLKTSKKNKS